VSAPLIYVVEDEPAQVEVLSYNLEKAGFRVVTTADGEQALLLVGESPPDLIILDWMLPEVSGIEVCRRLRARPESKTIPIIMLTARGEEADRVRGLEVGADDYVVKPYSPAEVVARTKALLRRSRPGFADERLEYAGIVVDLATRKVRRGGRAIHLGPTEFRLLTTLMERPGRVLNRAQLLDLVWGHDVHVEDRTVDVHIRRLRKALNATGEPDPVRTVRGTGYAIDEEVL
jgi:two-component system phosphate regulon response regulator PhoB